MNIKIKKLFLSFTYASAGIKYAIKRDQNLRIHFFATVLVVILSLFFQINTFEICILGIVILLVISTEMINSAIEEMVDLITTEHKKEAEIAKDLSAGMVLLTAIGSAIVGSIIFIPYIIKLFS